MDYPSIGVFDPRGVRKQKEAESDAKYIQTMEENWSKRNEPGRGRGGVFGGPPNDSTLHKEYEEYKEHFYRDKRNAGKPPSLSYDQFVAMRKQDYLRITKVLGSGVRSQFNQSTSGMKYHAHGVHLTEAQGHTLLKGGAIRMRHAQLTGPHTLHLTSQQLRRVQRSHGAKRGMQLRMSPTQVRQNLRGGGFLSNLWGKVKGLGRAHLPGLIDKGLEQLPGLLHAAQEKIHEKVGHHPVIDAALNYGRGKVQDAIRTGAQKAKRKLGVQAGQGLGFKIGTWKI